MTGRKRYLKPCVARVALKVEEAVLQSCKLRVQDTFGPSNTGYCGGYNGIWYGMCYEATS
ncbi:MAG: hypothetical protein ACUVTZ_10560 [Armatimonadota bacterium]